MGNNEAIIFVLSEFICHSAILTSCVSARRRVASFAVILDSISIPKGVTVFVSLPVSKDASHLSTKYLECFMALSELGSSYFRLMPWIIRRPSLRATLSLVFIGMCKGSDGWGEEDSTDWDEDAARRLGCPSL